jgi:hypothetical protein
MLFGGAWLLGELELTRIAPLILQALAFLFVVRIALNSAYGDPMGGVFKATGTNWPDSFAALGRLFLLNLIWAIPLVILGEGISQMPGQLMMGGGVAGPALLLALAMALLPPLFLVSALAAGSFSDLFDVDHWRSLFAGRLPDATALFATYFGGAVTASAMALLIGASLGNGKPGLTIFFLLVAGSYSLGITMLLLGRLVGGFIRTGHSGVGATELSPEPMPAGDPMVDEGWDPTRSASVFPIAETMTQEASSYTSQKPTAEGEQHDTAPISVGPATSRSVAPAVEQRLADPTPKATVSEVLRHVQRLAETDPERALSELEQHLSRQGPHPMVIGHLAILQDQMGKDEAMRTAQQAADLALSVGNVGVVGELFEVFRQRLFDLRLEPEQWQKVASASQGVGRIESATVLFCHVLENDPSNLASIKGLIQIAEGHLKAEDQTESAVVIYDLLDRMCPDNPFVDFVEAGRQAAERRLQKVR